MKMSIDWANTMNGPASSPNDPAASVVEQMLEGFGGGNFIFPEPEPEPGYVMKSLDWRLSTTLGLYLTEGLARAFQDINKGSMLYRQAPDVKQSYVRYLNNINEPSLKEGYRNGELDWVEMRDPRWNSSILTWDLWAPQNGYLEIAITVQRYGYGYGFQDVPIKLATTVLMMYAVLVSAHMILIVVRGRSYKGYSDMGEMLALAWKSAPAKELINTSAGIEKIQTWRQLIKVREGQGKHLQLVIGADENGENAPRRKPRAGAIYV